MLHWHPSAPVCDRGAWAGQLLEPERLLSWRLMGGVGLELGDDPLPSGRLPGWGPRQWEPQGLAFHLVSRDSGSWLEEGRVFWDHTWSSDVAAAASSWAPGHTSGPLPWTVSNHQASLCLNPVTSRNVKIGMIDLPPVVLSPVRDHHNEESPPQGSAVSPYPA